VLRAPQRSDGSGLLCKNGVPKLISVCCVKHQKCQGLVTTGAISEGLTECMDRAVEELFFSLLLTLATLLVGVVRKEGTFWPS